ncbi:unnamed protein product [Ixodes pacificus]
MMKKEGSYVHRNLRNRRCVHGRIPMTPKQGQLAHESPPPARFCDVTSAGGGGSRRWSSSMASLGTDDDPDSFGLGMRRGRTSNHVSILLLVARETRHTIR